MNFIQNTAVNAHSILILAVVLFYFIKTGEKETLQYKLFFCLLISNIALLLFDSMGGFLGSSDYSLFSSMGNLLFFMFLPVPACLWLMYAHLNIFKNEKRTKNLIYPLLTISLINIVLLFFSFFKGNYYSINSGKLQLAGSLYYIQVGLPFALLVTTLILVIAQKSRIPKSHFYSLLLFPVFPIASFVFQSIINDISIMVNSIVISLVMIFLNIQNKQIFKDHLTGLNNRKRLDDYFKRMISTGEKPISAIMIDVDNFKALNDEYGHKEGDLVLRAVARILKDSLGGNHFISRYGGDEFYIIINTSQTHELKEIVMEISARLNEYNLASKRPYNISLSMGYDVYDPSKKKIEDFFEHIDKLMYQNKRTPNKSS